MVLPTVDAVLGPLEPLRTIGLVQQEILVDVVLEHQKLSSWFGLVIARLFWIVFSQVVGHSPRQPKGRMVGSSNAWPNEELLKVFTFIVLDCIRVPGHFLIPTVTHCWSKRGRRPYFLLYVIHN